MYRKINNEEYKEDHEKRRKVRKGYTQLTLQTLAEIINDQTDLAIDEFKDKGSVTPHDMLSILEMLIDYDEEVWIYE